jgi:hypothetical protein
VYTSCVLRSAFFAFLIKFSYLSKKKKSLGCYVQPGK